MFKTPLIPSTEMFPADSMLTIVDGPAVGSVLGGIAMVRSTLALVDPEGSVTLAVNVLFVSAGAVVGGDEGLLVSGAVDVVLLGVAVA
jgi:hypothetical protein